MKKRNVIVLSALLLFLITGCGKQASTEETVAEPTAETTADMEKMFELQKSAIEANDTLLASFPLGEDGYEYPDDYGGNYISFDTLHVLSVSEEGLNRYREVLKDYDCVSYEIVKKSYNELMNHLEEIEEKYKGKYDIFECEISEERNKGILYVTEDGYEGLKEELSGDDDVIIKKGIPVELE